MYGFSFFFSSRRRHTRCLSDWSSDVCSSDLLLHHGLLAVDVFAGIHGVDRDTRVPVIRGGEDYGIHIAPRQRSEERRVGKECRARWWRDHYKKKTKCSGG